MKRKRSRSETPGQLPAKHETVPVTVSVLILVILIFLTYRGILDHEFVWDDDIHIVENRYDRDHGDGGLLKYWQPDDKLLYAPITYTFWGIAKQLSPGGFKDPDPFIFHLLNLLAHIGASLSVLFILRSVIGKNLVPLLGSLVFACHPLQVEAVAWATGLRILLAGFFSFLTILLYYYHLQKGSGKGKYYYLSVLAFLAAIFSKPSAVVLPLFLVLIQQIRKPSSLKETLRGLIPFFIISLIYSLFFIQTGDPVINEIPPLWARFFVFFDSLTFYLYKLLIPLELSSFYGRTPGSVMQVSWFYLSWIIPAGLLYLGLRYRKKGLLFLLAYLIFIAGILPVSGLIPFEGQNWNTAADRYLYLSMLGISLGFCVLFRKIKPKLLKGLMIILVLFWILRSHLVQVPLWQDNMTLWSRTIKMFPEQYIPYNRRAALLYRKGDLEGAVRDYTSALEINPSHLKSYYGRALALKKSGFPRRAIDDYSKVIQTVSSDTTAIYNRAMLYLETEQYQDAIADLDRVILLNNRDVMAYYNRAAVYHFLGQYQKAYDDLLRVRELGGQINEHFWQDVNKALEMEG